MRICVGSSTDSARRRQRSSGQTLHAVACVSVRERTLRARLLAATPSTRAAVRAEVPSSAASGRVRRPVSTHWASADAAVFCPHVAERLRAWLASRDDTRSMSARDVATVVTLASSTSRQVAVEVCWRRRSERAWIVVQLPALARPLRGAVAVDVDEAFAFTSERLDGAVASTRQRSRVTCSRRPVCALGVGVRRCGKHAIVGSPDGSARLTPATDRVTRCTWPIAQHGWGPPSTWEIARRAHGANGIDGAATAVAALEGLSALSPIDCGLATA